MYLDSNPLFRELIGIINSYNEDITQVNDEKSRNSNMFSD